MNLGQLSPLWTAVRWAFVALGFLVMLGGASWLLFGCAPLVCQTADVGIWPHPTKTKPAARIIVQCDGKPKIVLDAEKVGP